MKGNDLAYEKRMFLSHAAGGTYLSDALVPFNKANIIIPNKLSTGCEMFKKSISNEGRIMLDKKTMGDYGGHRWCYCRFGGDDTGCTRVTHAETLYINKKQDNCVLRIPVQVIICLCWFVLCLICWAYVPSIEHRGGGGYYSYMVNC